jgi:hypothetical protein
VAPFEMGKLGNANRRELELSGRYGYGQVRGMVVVGLAALR